MERKDNYAIQMVNAKQWFLKYDQEKVIKKCHLHADSQYLYAKMWGFLYRLNRQSGDLERQEDGIWLDANTFNEVLTLLDLLCDSREDRHLAGQWVSLQSLGLQFHQNLVEDGRDPLAELFDREPERLHRSCRAMGGEMLKGADISYAIELFDGLKVAVQFWHGDDEFAPRLRYMLDANAKMYLKYETMYYALGFLKHRLER